MKITVSHWLFSSQISKVVAHFLICLTHFKSRLLGDEQARRVVYTMVYAIPSYLVYLLATKILCVTSITLVFLIGQLTVGMSDQP